MRAPFTIDVDGRMVACVVDLPAGSSGGPGGGPWPVVLACHGVNGSRIGPNRAFVRMAEQLTEAGVATVRFDYRGTGDSEGGHEDFTLGNALADAQAVLDAAAARYPVDLTRLVLVGHSFGGVVATRLAVTRPGVRGVALWSTPGDLGPRHGAEGGRAAASTRGRDRVVEAGAPAGTVPGGTAPGGTVPAGTAAEGYDWHGFRLGPAFLAQLRQVRPPDELAQAGVPVLIVHGTSDEAVPVGQAERLAAALEEAGSVVRLELIDGADHSFSSRSHLTRLLRVTTGWVTGLLADVGG